MGIAGPSFCCWVGMQYGTTVTHAQMSLSIEGISANLQQSQAPNASQQSLHAAAQAFEQVHMTAAERLHTAYLLCLAYPRWTGRVVCKGVIRN